MSQPATKEDLRFVKLYHSFLFQIIVQVTLIGAIAGAQWAALILISQHLVWKP